MKVRHENNKRAVAGLHAGYNGSSLRVGAVGDRGEHDIACANGRVGQGQRVNRVLCGRQGFGRDLAETIGQSSGPGSGGCRAGVGGEDGSYGSLLLGWQVIGRVAG